LEIFAALMLVTDGKARNTYVQFGNSMTQNPPSMRITLEERLNRMLEDAICLAKTAKRHRQSLNGLNYYANRLADFRAESNSSYGYLSSLTSADGTEITNLIKKVFSVDASVKDRVAAARDIKFALRAVPADASRDQRYLEGEGIFPLVTLDQTKQGYMSAIGRQMNGSYTSGWYDACAVMMRRLLEAAIIEAFEAKKIDSKIKDAGGDFLQLTGLINAALGETAWNLSRGVKKALPGLRDLGHKSAHGRHYLAKKMYIDELKTQYRDSLEAFLHEANLI
jgi:hypothetical protein